MPLCPQCKRNFTQTDGGVDRVFCCKRCANAFKCKKYHAVHADKRNAKRREVYRERMATDPEFVEKNRAYARTNNRRVRRMLADYKTRTGCTDCGYKENAAALDFDHVSGEKAFNLSSVNSIAKALTEIGKCEVVCANCHRVRTYKRMQQRRRDAKNKDGDD